MGTDAPILRGVAGGVRISTAPSGLSLVVWNTNGDVYGGRIDANGVILDPVGFWISDFRASQSEPQVAWLDGRWLVIWSDDRSADSTDIYGAFVTPEGAVSDPDGIPFVTGPQDSSFLDLTASSTQWFATWVDTRSGWRDIYGARIDAAGTLLDTNGFVIADTGTEELNPAVASDGSSFLVVWDEAESEYEHADVFGARIGSDGTVLGDGVFGISTSEAAESFPSVASRGNGWFVSWIDSRNGVDRDVYGARIAGDGELLDPGGIPLAAAAGSQTDPKLIGGREDYLLIWEDWNERTGAVWGALVDPETGVARESRALAAPNASTPGASAFEGTWNLLWVDTLLGTSQTQRFDAELERIGAEPELVSRGPNAQEHPAASWNGTNWLVVWRDLRYELGAICAARFTADGTLLDSRTIEIFTGATAQSSPAVAYDGTNWLVAWIDLGGGPGVRAARVANDGAVLDVPFRLPNYGPALSIVDVVRGETGWLVVWGNYESSVNGAGDNDVVGTRISASGAVLDKGLIRVAANATERETTPHVVFDGSDWLVFWQQEGNGSWDIFGGRVSQAGTLRDPGGFPVSEAANAQMGPVASFNGSETLVAWTDTRNGTSDVYGARVALDGAVLDPEGIAISSGPQTYEFPTVAFAGENWIVAWGDDREGPSAHDLFATEVNPLGEVDPDDEITVSNARYTERYPVSTEGPDSQILLSYMTVSGPNTRVKLRILSEDDASGEGGTSGEGGASASAGAPSSAGEAGAAASGGSSPDHGHGPGFFGCGPHVHAYRSESGAGFGLLLLGALFGSRRRHRGRNSVSGS